MAGRGYDNGAGSSSSGASEKFRPGSFDATYKDMYDYMPSFSSEKAYNTNFSSIQGSNKVTSDISFSGETGSKDYGKGNPFKKAKITSIEQLRKLGSK